MGNIKEILLLVIFTFSGHIFAAENKTIQIEELSKTTNSWDGSLLPKYRDGQPEITILKIIIQPGAKIPWHNHPVINAGVILKGNLTIETKDGKKHKITEGESVVELVDKTHKGYNEGSTPVELIVFYAGVTGTPITIKQK